METNFFGLVATTKIIVPLMRARRSGHIINISSYGGLVGQPFNDAYCAAKFAVTGLSESMYSSLHPFGIKVTLVCPGAITTPFLDKAAKTVEMDPSNPYMPLGSAYIATMRKVFSDSGTSGIKSSQTADEIAEILKRLIEEDDPQFLCLTSQYIEKIAGFKLKDTTGRTMADLTLKRSYGEDWKNLV
jgi:short-subunit dehydrogenase